MEAADLFLVRNGKLLQKRLLLLYHLHRRTSSENNDRKKLQEELQIEMSDKIQKMCDKPRHGVSPHSECRSFLEFVKTFLKFGQDCANVYFSQNWKLIDSVYRVRGTRRGGGVEERQECRKNRAKKSILSDYIITDVMEITRLLSIRTSNDKLNRLLDDAQPKSTASSLVVVAVFPTKICPLLYRSLSKTAFLLHDKAKVVVIDPQREVHKEIYNQFGDHGFVDEGDGPRPTIRLFESGKCTSVFALTTKELCVNDLSTMPSFPKNHSVYGFTPTVENVLRFVRSRGKMEEEIVRQNERSKSERAMNHWRRAMMKIRGLRTRSLLARRRETLTILQKLNAMKCYGNTCKTFQHPKARKEPPRLYFVGGGMAAGKSTCIEAIRDSNFWSKYVVEADAIKRNDPAFSLAKSTDDPEALSAIHEHSVKAAEELLLEAIRHSRDIVFDGTMSWLPFVEQTVKMLKDSRHNWKLGPGYVTKGREGREKVVEERYWEEEGEAEETRRPYHIVLFGVTVEADIAVQRGIIRGIETGRTVPVRSQLQSHKLFSSNFPRYTELCDEVYLYHNQTDQYTHSPTLIVKKEEGRELKVIEEGLYRDFLRKRDINVDAKNHADLFPDGCITEKKVIDVENRDALRLFMGLGLNDIR
ncbi:hypothetical protein PROFUN_03990 [Planoprotostelium fungivorum]|uniref:Zeta toxin domain-containing protein n=1 Tax=Planoprotostelium fungivorum TaxID=1890364 RepID=A0A2P6NW22_9EUKA|nr:hypothetical protein PROFUN_03990 [Planoprotostelium fungivorum]